MYKLRLFYIVGIALLLNSCSVFKSPEKERMEDMSLRTSRFLQEVSGNNLTNHGFRFDRIRVVMDAAGEKRRFTANIKVDQRGTMLVSLRIIASIEVARVYIDNERVVVLDRLNRIYSTGETDKVLAKYGLRWDMMPLLFGDLPEGFITGQRIRCVSGKADLLLRKGVESYNAGFDCNKEKLTSFTGSSGIYSVNIMFRDFIKEGTTFYPENISFMEERSVMKVELSMAGYSEFSGTNSMPDKPSRYENGRIE